MNIIQRRKILKRTNYLDLVPVRLKEHKQEEDGKVTLLIPKFKNEAFARWFIPRRKSTSFTVRLDDLGSRAWLSIDAEKDVAAIASVLATHFAIPEEDARIRLTRFMTQLYDQRYITFTVLLDSNKA